MFSLSTHKYIDKICVAAIILALLVTILFMNGEALGLEAIEDKDAEQYSGTEYFTENDLDGSWITDNACSITLDGTGAAISGKGAYFYDGNVVLSNAGTYVISGSLTDGSIIVDAYDTSKVWIMLDGVNLYCEDDACLIIDQADKVFLTLAEGSTNSMESGSTFSEEALSDNTGGAIFAHDDLTINGSGSLSLKTGYKHGIDANDSLVITGGTISIECPQDGLHVNDDCNITNAALTIAAGDDGIHSDTSFYMESGTLTITECYEGIEAVVIEIAGGDLLIYPSDDGLNANGSTGMGTGFGAGEATEETYIRITGGTLTVINENGRDADGLDSNGSIYIEGGTVLVNLLGSNGNCALDYGSESGGTLEVSGGTVIACGDSSMAEEFSSSSTQCAVLFNLSQTAQAGTELTVSDSSGNVILRHTPAASYTSVAFSCPEMVVGETYTLIAGDVSAEITMDSTVASYGSGGGAMGNPGGDMGGEPGGGMGGGMGSEPGGDMGGDRPEMPQDGEMPEMPQDGEMPEMPQDGEMPEMPQDGEMPGMQEQEETAAVQSTENEEASSSTSLTLSDGVLLGCSAAALAIGLLIAILYKKN